MTGEETEIQRIERELEILRARYALFRKWARITKYFLAVVVPAIAILILALIVRETLDDLVLGLFFTGVLCVVAGLLWYVYKTGSLFQNPRARQWRAVDMISPQPYPAGFVPMFRYYMGPLSEAQEIEDMISARENRLAQLREVRP